MRLMLPGSHGSVVQVGIAVMLLVHSTVLRLPAAQVTALAFAPDGRTLAAGCADGSIVLWDLAEARRTVAVAERHRGPVWSLAFSHGAGGMLASGETKSLHLHYSEGLWRERGCKWVNYAHAIEAALAQSRCEVEFNSARYTCCHLKVRLAACSDGPDWID